MMDDHTQPGGASEEEALRGLFHGAVEGLQPSADALERLRHAVPARRARKRPLDEPALLEVLQDGVHGRWRHPAQPGERG
ncbi:hypothetical protein AB0B44_40650, partial [Streptomyces sp. NPDC041003]